MEKLKKKYEWKQSSKHEWVCVKSALRVKYLRPKWLAYADPRYVGSFTDRELAMNRASYASEHPNEPHQSEGSSDLPETNEMTNVDVSNGSKAKRSKKAAKATEAKTPTVRTGRTFPAGAKITLLCDSNPKRVGSKAYTRFALYRTGMTVEEFLKAGGSTSTLYYDSGHGYISIK